MASSGSSPPGSPGDASVYTPAQIEAALSDEELDQALISEARRLLNPAEIAAILKTFLELDVSGGGALKPDQVFVAMRGANPSATRDEVNELIAEFDENKDGEIQLDEFLVMMGSLFGIASGEEQKAKGDRASTALKKSWRRRQSGHPNLLQSLEQMKTATDDYVNNRQKAYINIGGIDASYLVHESLEGFSIYALGTYDDNSEARRNTAHTDIMKKETYKPSSTAALPTTGARRSAIVQVDKKSTRGEHYGFSDSKPAFKTKTVESDGSAIIWNATFRVELPQPAPKVLRIDFYAVPPSIALSDEQKLLMPLRVATATVQIGDIARDSWSEDLRIVHLERLSLPDLLRQEHQQMNALLLTAPISPIKAGSRSSSSGGLVAKPREKSTTLSAIPHLSVNGNVIVPGDGTPATEEECDETKDFDFGAERQQQFQPKQTRNRSFRFNRLTENKTGRDRSIAAMLHAAIPKTTRLGISIVKDPRVLAQTEAMWNSREISGNRSIRLMERPWYIVSPTNRRVNHWEIIVACAMVFVSIVTPYEVSVLRVDRDERPGINLEEFSHLRILNSISDIIFTLDMILQFFLGYFDRHRNQIVNDPGFIFRRYVSSWFFFDFVSIFPFDLARGNADLRKLRVLRIMRLIKLVKLTRLVRLGNALSIQSQYLKLIKFTLFLAYLLHWISCGWCLLAQLQHDMEQDAWVDSERVHITGAASRYLHGLEFAISAMVLTYPRANPINVNEQLFAITMLIIMGGVYALGIGSICGIISSMDPAGTEYRNKTDLVKAWTSDMHFPRELRMALLDYMDESRVLIRQRYYHSLLEVLSPTLRLRVTNHTHGHMMLSVPFFTCDDPKESRKFIAAVTSKLTTRIFGKAEVIASVGDSATVLNIISKGVVAQSNGIVLCQGRFFGEDMMLRGGSYPCTFRTVTFVTVQELAKRDLFAVLATGHFPCTWGSMRRWIIRRAFHRVVKSIVNLKRADPSYKPLSYDQFKQEREKLIQIGRRGKSPAQAAAAQNGDDSSAIRVSPPGSNPYINTMLSKIREPPTTSAQNYAKMVRYAMRVGEGENELEEEDKYVTVSKISELVHAAEARLLERIDSSTNTELAQRVGNIEVKLDTLIAELRGAKTGGGVGGKTQPVSAPVRHVPAPLSSLAPVHPITSTRRDPLRPPTLEPLDLETNEA